MLFLQGSSSAAAGWWHKVFGGSSSGKRSLRSRPVTKVSHICPQLPEGANTEPDRKERSPRESTAVGGTKVPREVCSKGIFCHWRAHLRGIAAGPIMTP